MIDIETTGTDKTKDSILEIGIVEIEYRFAAWYPTGKEFHRIFHYAGKPETPFAKQHMKELYEKCNNQPVVINVENAVNDLKHFLHAEPYTYPVESHGRESTATGEKIPEIIKPKLFMGWNAAGFDLPFMFHNKLLTPSYHHVLPDGKEELRGDVHYRIYEQMGALNVITNMTGLTEKTVKQLAMDLNPTGLKLPEGKDHDALYDCYKQIILMNGLIAIGKKGISKY